MNCRRVSLIVFAALQVAVFAIFWIPYARAVADAWQPSGYQGMTPTLDGEYLPGFELVLDLNTVAVAEMVLLGQLSLVALIPLTRPRSVRLVLVSLASVYSIPLMLGQWANGTDGIADEVQVLFAFLVPSFALTAVLARRGFYLSTKGTVSSWGLRFSLRSLICAQIVLSLLFSCWLNVHSDYFGNAAAGLLWGFFSGAITSLVLFTRHPLIWLISMMLLAGSASLAIEGPVTRWVVVSLVGISLIPNVLSLLLLRAAGYRLVRIEPSLLQGRNAAYSQLPLARSAV